MAKKRKHVYVITDTDYNGNENPNKAIIWNSECLADYFYMEYYQKDEYELEENPNDEYYRGNTCLEVEKRRKRKSYKDDKGKLHWEFIEYEIYKIHKMDYHGVWHEVTTSDSMDEICNLFDLFNIHYYSFGWNTFYEQYIDSMEG